MGFFDDLFLGLVDGQSKRNIGKKKSVEQIQQESDARTNKGYNTELRNILNKEFVYSYIDLYEQASHFLKLAENSTYYSAQGFVMDADVKKLFDDVKTKSQKEKLEREQSRQLQLSRELSEEHNEELRRFLSKMEYDIDYVRVYKFALSKLHSIEKQVANKGGKFVLTEANKNTIEKFRRQSEEQSAREKKISTVVHNITVGKELSEKIDYVSNSQLMTDEEKELMLQEYKSQPEFRYYHDLFNKEPQEEKKELTEFECRCIQKLEENGYVNIEFQPVKSSIDLMAYKNDALYRIWCKGKALDSTIEMVPESVWVDCICVLPYVEYLNEEQSIGNYYSEKGFKNVKFTKTSENVIMGYAEKHNTKFAIKLYFDADKMTTPVNKPLDTEKSNIPDFDSMDGHEFEHFCAELLKQNGYKDVEVTQGSGDQGIDIIAYKDYIKYGIQCKCYASDVGNKAVQEVFAGKTFYQCHVGIVLTNSYFTKSAIELAQMNGIVLWDRDKLLDMIKNN